MNKKIIIIGMAIVFLVGIAVFSSQKDKYLQKIKHQEKTLLNKQKKQLAKQGVLLCLLVLKRLLMSFVNNIKTRFVKKKIKFTASIILNLTKKTGEKRIRNLQWNNLCALVREFGRMNSDLYEYETIGYEEKPCYQGMYAK